MRHRARKGKREAVAAEWFHFVRGVEMLNDSWRRGLRTAYQLVVSLVAVLPTLALLDWGDDTGKALATLMVWGAVFTKLINALEDKGLIPAFLKAPASDGANPVP